MLNLHRNYGEPTVFSDIFIEDTIWIYDFPIPTIVLIALIVIFLLWWVTRIIKDLTENK